MWGLVAKGGFCGASSFGVSIRYFDFCVMVFSNWWWISFYCVFDDLGLGWLCFVRFRTVIVFWFDIVWIWCFLI